MYLLVLHSNASLSLPGHCLYLTWKSTSNLLRDIDQSIKAFVCSNMDLTASLQLQDALPRPVWAPGGGRYVDRQALLRQSVCAGQPSRPILHGLPLDLPAGFPNRVHVSHSATNTTLLWMWGITAFHWITVVKSAECTSSPQGNGSAISTQRLLLPKKQDQGMAPGSLATTDFI